MGRDLHLALTQETMHIERVSPSLDPRDISIYIYIYIYRVGRWVMSGLGLPPRGSYQGAFAHPPTALLHVPPQGGSTTWGKQYPTAGSAQRGNPSSTDVSHSSSSGG